MIVALRYCLSMNDRLPCRNCVRCWQEGISITDLLRNSFSEEELQKAFGGPPKSRLDRILESVDQG
jgi:hypothetical protein